MARNSIGRQAEAPNAELEEDGAERAAHTNNSLGPKLRIVGLFAPEEAQNGTQNVTLGECTELWRPSGAPQKPPH